MPPRATPITSAVAALALPHDVERRLARALDKYLAHPSAGHHPYRQAARASIGVLMLEGHSRDELRDRLARAVAGHAEERGFYARSVVRGVPRYQRACDLADRWVCELVAADAGNGAHTASAHEAPDPFTSRALDRGWERRAAESRGRSQNSGAAD